MSGRPLLSSAFLLSRLLLSQSGARMLLLGVGLLLGLAAMPAAAQDSQSQEKWAPGPLQIGARIPRPTALPGVTKWEIQTFAPDLPQKERPRSAISPDGSRIAVLRGSVIYFYEVATQHLVDVHFSPDAAVTYVDAAWQPNGKYLALARSDHVIEMRPLAEGVEPRVFNNMQLAVGLLTWSPDSYYLAAVVGNQVAVLSEDGFEELRGPEDRYPQQSLVWRPDSRALVSVGNTTLTKWDIISGTFTPWARLRKMSDVAWSPDGNRMVISAEDRPGLLVMVDSNGDTLIQTESADQPGPRSVFWNGESGLIQTAGTGPTVTLANDKLEVTATLSAPQPNYARAYWSADGSTCVLEAKGGGVDIVRVATGESFRLQPMRIGSISCAPDGATIAIGDSAGQIRFYSPSWELKGTVPSSFGSSLGVSFSPDGKLLAVFPAGRQDFEVRTATGELVQSFPGEGGGARAFAWSSTSDALATAGGDQIVRVWSLQGNLKHKFQHDSPVVALAWAPHRLLATQDAKANVKVFDLESEVIHNVPGSLAGAVSWRPRTDELLIGGAQIWKVGGRSVTNLMEINPRAKPKRICNIWSPGGDHLLWSQGEAIGVSKINASAPAVTSIGPRQEFSDITLTSVHGAAWLAPSQQLLIPTGDDVRTYDLETLELKTVMLPLIDGTMVAFSPAGAILNGQPEDFDGRIYYVIQGEDGTRLILPPSEFYKRFDLPR